MLLRLQPASRFFIRHSARKMICFSNGSGPRRRFVHRDAIQPLWYQKAQASGFDDSCQLSGQNVHLLFIVVHAEGDPDRAVRIFLRYPDGPDDMAQDGIL